MLVPIEVAAARLRQADHGAYIALVNACKRWEVVPKHVAIAALKCGFIICPQTGYIFGSGVREALAEMKICECSPIQTIADATRAIAPFLFGEVDLSYRIVCALEAVCTCAEALPVEDPHSSRILYEFGLVGPNGVPNFFTRGFFVQPDEYRDTDALLSLGPTYHGYVM